MSKKGVYLSLKNNGVGIIKNGIAIKSTDFETFKRMVGNKQWKYVDLGEGLNEVLKEHRFPKDQFDFSMNFSVLKSDPGLHIPQHAHIN